ncbi:MAG: glycoside hydrolase family 95 protein [Acidobacteriota bacterium]|nr:glycoside hydrolase family 95 protein [Acidobacteriota bacterium]
MMTRITELIAISALSILGGMSGQTARVQAAEARPVPREVLWYRAPAPVWDNALPIGNGRLGAMVFGGANAGENNGDRQASPKNAPLMDGSQTSGADEHLQLNESSLWRGGRSDRLNPRAHEAVPQIRKLLLDSKGLDSAKISAAEKMAQEDMIGIPPGMPGYSTLGDLYLRAPKQGAIRDYRRQLDLGTGIVRVTYAMDGVHYTREVFASVPDEVIVLRLTANRKGSIAFRASMDRPADFSVAARGQHTLILREGADHKDQIRFAGVALFLPTGGSVHSEGSEIVVTNADALTVLIAAATDFKGGPFAGGDPVAQCERTLSNARKRSAEEILKRQEAVYQPQFRRMALHLGAAQNAGNTLPTDERVKRVSEGADDLGLQELYFQFARYLLISSSRPDGLPANLQGIWAAGIDNPWGSKYTINVNTEMNYWLAEPAGLGDTMLPLINLINMVRKPTTGTGTQVARTYYGARGFVIHHNTDLWGDADPIDGYQWGIWPMGGAWLSLDAWDHYAFTLDREFLRARAWPILHDASLFFLDYLVDDGSGHLVTGPSISPENRYRLPDGTGHSLTMGPTMDIEIVRELFTRTIDAGRILGQDAEFLNQIRSALDKLPPFKVGKHGQLQEWQRDYDEPEPGHRHISHLWALFPGTQITLEHTPELAKAARISLERRLSFGGGQTGWSRAWVVNYWDHLHDGKQAYDSLQVMFRQSTFPNLMDTHPPGLFQIDGNLGAANGMLEALVQSRWLPDASEIELLPALPQQWTEGSVEGLRVRGGLAIDMRWKSGRVTSLQLHSTAGGAMRLNPPAGQAIARVTTAAGRTVPVGADGVIHLDRGSAYRVVFR